MCDAEVEKMWEKKVKQWKLEKEARRKLLVDVMAGRRRQLEEKRSLLLLSFDFVTEKSVAMGLHVTDCLFVYSNILMVFTWGH